MKDSDILRDLISLAFDHDPAEAEVTLKQCLDLLSKTVAAEQQNVPAAGSSGMVFPAPPPQKRRLRACRRKP